MRAILLLPEPATDARVAGLVLSPAEGPLAPELVAPAIRRAWYWPDALPEIAHHRATLTVALEAPPDDPLDHALALTRAAAALGTELSAIGVFWEPTSLVHSTASFAEQAADATRDDPPIFLWVAFDGSDMRAALESASAERKAAEANHDAARAQAIRFDSLFAAGPMAAAT